MDGCGVVVVQVGFAALGALASLVSPVRPAAAAVRVPIFDCALVGSAYPPDTAVGMPLSTPATVRGTNRVVQGETVNVIIPRAEGVLTMTVSNAPVQLSTPVLSADKKTFRLTGQLPTVAVEDNRNQSQPGWSISGQVSDFKGGGPTVSGSNLGWTPMVIKQNAAQDVAVGPAVSPGTDPGLKVGNSQAVAVATKGLGTTIVGATLDLKISASASAGPQLATLTVTLMQDA